MTGPVERSRQLELTGRRIVAGTWGCAGITMAASAANAALTYGALGDNRALGLATGVAVDIGLCVALIGDRQLYAHGLSSNWGRTLRVTTAVMSLILNVGISLRDGHYFAALLHSFLPVLLIVLCEYGQDVLLQLTALRRKQDAAEQPTSPPVPEPLPQLHRPLAPPPVAAAPIPAVRPIPNPHHEEEPAWTPTRTSITSPASTTTASSFAPESPTNNGGSLSLAGGSSPSTAASAAPSVIPTPVPHAAEPSPAQMPAPPADDEITTRVRQLIRDNGGQAPGRRTVARQLGITEHQARVVLDQLVTAGSPAGNGHEPAKPTASGQVQR